MNGGFFKIHRQIFDSDIFLNPGLLRLFLYLIGKARYSEKPNSKYKSHDIIIKRGQFLRSYRKIQDDLEYLDNRAIKKYSLSTIKDNLDRLEEQNRIERKKTQLGTLFTIVNYNKYQDLQTNKNRTSNGVRTDSERSANDLRTTSEQYSKKDKERSKKAKKGRKNVFEQNQNIPYDQIKQKFLEISGKKVNLIHNDKEKDYMREFWPLACKTAVKNDNYSDDAWDIVKEVFEQSQNTFIDKGFGFLQSVNPNNFNALLNGEFKKESGGL